MKNKSKLSKEYVWTCDYCGKEFGTKKLSDAHELTCVKRDREITIKFRAPKFGSMFQAMFLFLFFYFLTYLLINSYATSNGLPMRDLIKPHEWFGSKPEPTVSLIKPTETPTMAPTAKPKINSVVKSSTNTGSGIECIGPDGKQFNTSMAECEKLNKSWGSNTDYLVNCNVNSNCGGGTKYIRKSECDNSTCCQIGSNWIFYTSKQKCKTDQGNSYNGSYKYVIPTYAPIPTFKSTQSYPPCTVYYPGLNYSQTYNGIPPEQCLQWINDARSSVVKPTSVPTVDRSKCDQAVSEWESYKADFFATAYNGYSSSAEAMKVLESQRNELQSMLDSYGCPNVLRL